MAGHHVLTLSENVDKAPADLIQPAWFCELLHERGWLYRDPAAQRFPKRAIHLTELRLEIQECVREVLDRGQRTGVLKTSLDFKAVGRWAVSHALKSAQALRVSSHGRFKEVLVQMEVAWYERFWTVISTGAPDSDIEKTS